MNKSKRELFSQEAKLSSYIPYSYFVDKCSVRTRAGDIASFMKLDGIKVDTMDMNKLHDQNKRLSKFFAEKGLEIALWNIFVKKRDSIAEKEEILGGYPGQFYRDYIKEYKRKELFHVNNYMSLILRQDLPYKINMKKWTFSEKKDYRHYKNHCDIMRRKSDQFVEQLVSCCEESGCKTLSSNTEKGIETSEVMELLSNIINGEKNTYPFPLSEISYVVPNKRLFFGDSIIQWKGSTNKENKYAAILSIKSFGMHSFPGKSNPILDLPIECIITHSFQPFDIEAASQRIKTQRSRLEQVQDPAFSQISELNIALDELHSGKNTFGYHHGTVMVISSSIPDLEESIQKVKSVYQLKGMSLVRETLNLESAFWAQLPGNFEEVRRKNIISSDNYADMVSSIAPATGYQDKNHLGGYLILTETAHQSKFLLNLHREGSVNSPSLGMTTIIGPSRSGKTVLMAACDVMSRKYGGRSIFFDRNRGLEIYIRANDGNYISFNPNKKMSLNPIPPSDNASNRYFLYSFILALINKNDSEITSEDQIEIMTAIDGLYSLQSSERNLKNLTAFFSIDWEYKHSFNQWLYEKNGIRAYMFDHENDEFYLSNNTIGFDMTEILKDKVALFPLLLLLFHRIEELLDGELFGIYLDEGWQLLSQPYWEKKIGEWINTLAKKNAYVVFATQNPHAISESPLCYELIQGAATNIYFPNANALKEVYINVFQLDEKEYEVVRSLGEGSKSFLYKQDLESSIVKFDMSRMQQHLAVMSGTTKSVRLMHKLRKEHGERSQDWLKIFQNLITEG